MADPRFAVLAASPFRLLPDVARDALLAIGKVERWARRLRISTQGEPARAFVVLGSGRVKIERIRDGRSFPIAHRGPGQMIGEAAIVAAGPVTETAIVADETEALVFALGPFRKLLANDGDLRAALTAALLAEQRAAEARLEGLLLLGVEARVAELLIKCLERWGKPHPNGTIVDAPFTHADIALLVGSTRETVTLLLGKLKRAQLIAFDRRRVVVRDRDALARHVTAC